MMLSDGGLTVLWSRITGYVAGYCENIAARVEAFSEEDPTVPSWAKKPTKPSYTYSEVGALSAATPIPNVYGWALSSRKPSYTYTEVGALSSATVIPSVPSWALSSSKPRYTYSEVGALSAATVLPVVPSNVGAFSNDVGYITQSEFSSLKRRVRALENGGLGPQTQMAVTAYVDEGWLTISGDATVDDGMLSVSGAFVDSDGILHIDDVAGSGSGYVTREYVDELISSLTSVISEQSDAMSALMSRVSALEGGG